MCVTNECIWTITFLGGYNRRQCRLTLNYISIFNCNDLINRIAKHTQQTQYAPYLYHAQSDIIDSIPTLCTYTLKIIIKKTKTISNKMINAFFLYFCYGYDDENSAREGVQVRWIDCCFYLINLSCHVFKLIQVNNIIG